MVDATGEVFGEAPNVAARVEAAAEPGTALVTAAVQRQIAGLFVVEDRGPHELKGVARPIALYRLVRASGAGRRGGSRALTPFVGREAELAQLSRHWERARSGEGQFVQIVGEPGIGKSRLIEEFRARLGETPHSWVEWAASQLLQNTPLHPLAEWGRLRFGGAEVAVEKRLADLEQALAQVKLDPGEDAALLAPLLDLPSPETHAPQLAREELRRRQLATITAWIFAGARAQPLVLAVEDLHWADPTTLDLMKGLAEDGASAPVLIVATARAEFRAPWAPRAHHGVVSLLPLDRGEVRTMVGAIAERHALANEVVEGVTDRTGGVPLFVEEVTRLLVEGGEQTIPPTLEQSLAARLDRLGEAREVAQIGAVLGRDFSFALLSAVATGAGPAVAAVADRGGGVADPALRRDGALGEAAVRSALDRLVEADLLFVEGTAPDDTYRFKHALVQDAAYESMLRSRRRTLHRRAAETLVAAADPQPELVAHHYTQADETGCAIEWWGKAGDAALQRSAFQEAIAHLGKAIAMSDRDTTPSVPPASGAETAERRQRDLKFRANYARAVLVTKGPIGEDTRSAYERVREIGAADGTGSEFWAAGYAQWMVAASRGDYSLAQQTAAMLLDEAEKAGLVMHVAAGRMMLGLVAFYQGELALSRNCYELAIDAYRPEFADLWRGALVQDFLTSCFIVLPLVEWHGGRFDRALEFRKRGIERATETGHVPSIGNALLFGVLFEAQRGDPEATRDAVEAMLKIATDHHMAFHLAQGSVYGAWASGRISDPSAFVGPLRQAVLGFNGLGLRNCTSWFQGMIADLQWRSGDYDDALRSVGEGLAIAQETGERFSEPFLHLLRGDVLLKRDPSDAKSGGSRVQDGDRGGHRTRSPLLRASRVARARQTLPIDQPARRGA